MFIPDVQPGEPILADYTTEVKNAACRDLQGDECESSPLGHFVGSRNSERLELYELTGVMAVDGSDDQWTATAKPVRLQTAGKWAVVAGALEEDVWMPAAAQNGSDEGWGEVPYTTGQRVYTRMMDGGKRQVVSPPLLIWRCELLTALVPFGSATVCLLPYTGGALTASTSITFTAYDWQGFRGRARNESGTPHIAGFQGFVKYQPDADRWEFMCLDPNVHAIRCQAVGAVSGTGSFSIDNVTKMFPTIGAGYLSVDGEPPTTLDNDDEMEWDDDDWILAFWDDDEEKFRPTKAFDGKDDASERFKLLRFGVVQSFTNDVMDASYEVTLQACGYDGGGAAGATFSVYTPMLGAHRTTALFAGNVVGYLEDANGVKVIVTPCDDDPIGTVRFQNTDTVPEGWTDYTGTIGGKFVMGETAAPYTLGSSGGNMTHTHPDDDIVAAIAEHSAAQVAGSIADHPAHCHGDDYGAVCVDDDGNKAVTVWDHYYGYTADAAAMAHSAGATALSHVASGTDVVLEQAPPWLALFVIVRTS